jgi:AAA15 family ATPase/GTPase
MLVVQKSANTLLSFPLHLVPDTFQRYIFHLAAIMSNRRSVLLFEEPESHSYPPYIYQLAQYILDDEGKNQFFITTHSPYFLTPLMQEGKDVAVFATWFEDYQTHARRLSGDEISEMLNYGVDIFLNLDHFTQA